MLIDGCLISGASVELSLTQLSNADADDICDQLEETVERQTPVHDSDTHMTIERHKHRVAFLKQLCYPTVFINC